ncbi:hypothetical protein BDCR2A_01565 [Borrelia duttonii CR2A]|uniref:Uncharacterized protein n=1 Tax=Borrelia duttonii CR2A TaxID=1432657 RepID=W6TGG5_9SPIR|nr:hypothetical protein BDCR2A_01565 [Borrelia duttonii CR2A]
MKQAVKEIRYFEAFESNALEVGTTQIFVTK